MNLPGPDSSSGIPPIEAVAIEWLLERSEGFSAQRRLEFAGWLAADPRHAAAVARLEQSMAVLDELPALRHEIEAAFGAGPRSLVAMHPAATLPSRRKRPVLPGWLAIGGVAAAIALGGFAWLQISSDRDEHRYATAANTRDTIQLRDGSVVELNAATTSRIRFTDTERRVELEAGEAHFAVARDPARPFIVTVGNVAVRAVGTAFNVRRVAGAVEVVVVEGKVEVTPAPAANGPAVAPLVHAGERAVVPQDLAVAPLRVEKIDADAIRAALRWQPSVAEFSEEPLGDILARFNRRNRLQLTLDDPGLGARRIAGVFALDQPEAFVRLLERDGDVAAERRGATEIHLRPKR